MQSSVGSFSLGSASAGSPAAKYFSIYDQDTNDHRFIISSIGNVGVATTSPTGPFTIGSDSGVYPYMTFDNSNETSADGTNLGAIFFKGKQPDGSFETGAAVRARGAGDAASSNNNLPGELTFQTNPGGTGGLKERMTIDKDGNVGIGTTQPAQSLHIKNTSPIIRLEDTNSGLSSEVYGDTGSGSLFLMSDITDGGTNQVIGFRIGGTALADEKMRITSDGHVGIGTTGPNVKLEVYGDPIADESKVSIVQRWVGEDSKCIFEVLKHSDTGLTEFRNNKYSDGVNGNYAFSDGNVGIGVTNPEAFDGEANQLVVRGATNGGMTIFAGTATSRGNIYFSDGVTGTQAYSGGITYDHGDDDISIRTGGTEKVWVKATGNVGIGVSNPGARFEVHCDTNSLISDFRSTKDGNGGYIQIRGSTTSGSSGNVYLGNGVPLVIGAKASSGTLRTQGDLILATGGANERIRISSSGVVGIGVPTASEPSAGRLDIHAEENSPYGTIKSVRPGTADRKHIVFYNALGIVGDIKTSGSTTSYNTSSDYRLKENVVEISDAMERVNMLKPCKFNFKSDQERVVDGFLAHEVQDIVPEAISGEKDAMTTEVLYTEDDDLPDGKSIGDVKEASVPEMQGIDQSKLVPLLTAAIQEQQVMIEQLKSRVEELEDK